MRLNKKIDDVDFGRSVVGLSYGDLVKNAKEIEKILLSFEILLDQLLREHKKVNSVWITHDPREMISILRGPWLNSTRSKLKKLDRCFIKVQEAVIDMCYANVLGNHHGGIQYWQKNEGGARVYKNSLVAELSIPGGKLYQELAHGTKTHQLATKLKDDVAGLLAIMLKMIELQPDMK